MAIKTGEQFLEEVKKLTPEVYCMGEKVEDMINHPILKQPLKNMCRTYDAAHDPVTAKYATEESTLIKGEIINRFNGLFTSREALFNRIQYLRLWQNYVAACTYRCPANGLFNALFSITADMDEKNGTNYHGRFVDYLKWCQKNDIFVSGAIMDVRGDRSLPPGKQVDPDMYVRVVEKRKDGIVVRGAKAHQSGSMLAQETLVIPGAVMRTEDEKDYAVSFAVPNGTKGMTYIVQHSFGDDRALVAEDIDLGNVKYGSRFDATALLIFDDVFVPWERVFMCGEYDFTQTLFRRFLPIMRMFEAGCRPGLFDVLIGASMAMAEYNGIARASHVRSKLQRMAYIAQSTYGVAIAGCHFAKEVPGGIYIPDQVYCSTSKITSIDGWYEVAKLAIDITGGLSMSLPSEKDWRHPVAGKFMEKYLRGNPQYSTEERIRMIRLIESLTQGAMGPSLHHGGGPLEAHYTTIRQSLVTEHQKNLAKALAGITDKKSK
nr:hypothetical protein [Desulfobacterales bacterium]